MKVFTASEACRRLAEILDLAETEDVYITRHGGDVFRLMPELRLPSPLDVPFIKTGATTKDILNAVRISRRRSG